MPLAVKHNGKTGINHFKEITEEFRKKAEEDGTYFYFNFPFTIADDEWSQNCFLFCIDVNLSEIEKAYDMDFSILTVDDPEEDPCYSRFVSPQELKKTLHKLYLHIKKDSKLFDSLDIEQYDITHEELCEAMEDMIKRIEYAESQKFDSVALEYNSFLI